MIVCPNCNHQNPDGAVQCEACYTPLPALASCPNCGASVQSDASFCGQCGFNLKAAGTDAAVPPEESTLVPQEETVSTQGDLSIPELVPPDPLIPPEPISPPSPPAPAVPAVSEAKEEPPPPLPVTPAAAVAYPPSAPATTSGETYGGTTQLQTQKVVLLHVQTDTPLELPSQLTLVRIGKPNDRVPPHIDVSGFPNSEIVSRVHADIRVEGDIYYIEDVGSSNGTYINNMPLAPGNRHRLRPGDKVSLGKGDKVTFIFQLT